MPKRLTPAQIYARNAAEHRHMVNRLLSVYAEASPEVRREGREWYPTAAATVAQIAGDTPLDRAAAIVAVLSPRERWRKNIENARAVLTGGEARGLYGSIAKAEAIRDGAAIGTGPGDGLGGPAPKVRAFWRNLCGDGDAVTVDVWATRAATGNRHDAPPTPAFYERIADAYRAAAERVGERPCDFQAIVWLTVRPSVEHDRDKREVASVC